MGPLHALSIDVEDYFHVENFRGVIDPAAWDTHELRVGRNTRVILDLLARRGVRATFFVLGWVAERCPDLVREIAEAGHEVACHGYAHERISTLSPEAFRADLCRARDLIASITGGEVIGFRAPSYSIVRETLWALDILIEEGFRYDSSIFPVHHDRYGIPDFSRFPERIERKGGVIVEFPPSTVRLFGTNVPVAGGGYLRLLPFPLIRWGLHTISEREGKPVMFYLHPWEIDPEQPRIEGISWKTRFRHYHGLSGTLAKLDFLLSRYRFGRVIDVLEIE